MDKEQLREAIKKLSFMDKEGDVTGASDICYKAAQAHLKLLDGIEGLRKKYAVNDSEAYGHNKALDDVMKLMEE